MTAKETGNPGPGPLGGLRVLDLSRVLSGPFCTALLADLGAEVIKVETPGRGDDSRHFGPHVKGESLYFALINRNKKSITLNLKHPRASELLRSVAAHCDVVVENFRPGVAQRLGLDYPTLCASNPRLVYLSITGFGQDGPCAGWAAYDLIVQAMSGIMSVTGQPDGPPTALGESLADLWTGLTGAWAVLAALHERTRSGCGDRIDLAMFDSLLAMQMTGLANLQASGRAPPRVGNRHPATSPVNTYRCRGALVALVVPSDAQFRALCELMGDAGLCADARFRRNTDRFENEAALRERIEGWTQSLAVDEVVSRCHAAGIAAGPVWDLKQAAESAQASARGLLRPVSHPAFGELRVATQPARFARAAPDAPRREPALGEHTDEVLSQLLGLDAAAIAALRKDGAL
ncbi:MAG TPA: CaiB/BaiF CoA-transferase family protein [Burkholderiales bacterium]|nr:CaiB/BaiF CoA-transferase family protein [Burkholderiales bacterium]